MQLLRTPGEGRLHPNRNRRESKAGGIHHVVGQTRSLLLIEDYCQSKAIFRPGVRKIWPAMSLSITLCTSRNNS